MLHISGLQGICVVVGVVVVVGGVVVGGVVVGVVVGVGVGDVSQYGFSLSCTCHVCPISEHEG